MGRYRSGNFVYHNDVISAEELEQQTGKFGYLVWRDRLRMNSKGELFLEADAPVTRTRDNSFQELLVRAVKGGVEVELLGYEMLAPGVPGTGRPSRSAIPVKRIKAGGKWYKKWDDEIRYHSIMVMPIGKGTKWFIERHLISNSGDAFCTNHLSGVKKKGGTGRVSIRRLAKDDYQVEMPRRGWLSLRVD